MTSARIDDGDRTVRDPNPVPRDRPAARVPVLHRAKADTSVSGDLFPSLPDAEVDSEAVVRHRGAAVPHDLARAIGRARLEAPVDRSRRP